MESRWKWGWCSILLKIPYIKYSVKDKNNLVDYNVWSGTDYLKNITGFTKSPTSSTDWSSNGERSLKLTRTSDNYNDYTTESYFNLPAGNYLFECKLYSPNANGRLTLFLGSENVSIDFYKSSNVQNISFTIDNDSFNGMRVSIYSSLESVYLDDVNITVL